MKTLSLTASLCLLLAASAALQAQTRQGTLIQATNLPDISVIGNFQASSVKNDSSKTGFAMKEIELALQGYLYPTIRSDIFLGIHKEDGETSVHLEEAYLTFSSLGEGLGAKAGKKLLSFGKQNSRHPEQWAWSEKPQSITNFLGEEGLGAEGISVDWLLPVPFFLQAELGFWQNTPHAHDAHEEGSEETHSTFAWSNWLTQARLWSSVAPIEDAEFEWGISYLTGSGADYVTHTDEAKLWGTDMTFRYWMADKSEITLQSEWMTLNRNTEDHSFDRWGGYAYVGYKPNKTWEFGLRGDYAETAEEDKGLSKSLSLIATYQLTETSKFRLHYQNDLDKDNHGIFAQMLFGVGPHSHILQ